jgi:ribosome-binding ATPase YchF (GTP1/OBG family)
MLIGIVGAPNKGKSTLFSALTLNDVAIADYPFTTIDPNLGIAHATTECPCARMQKRCNARNSLCANGTRKIPVNVIDVAGLVEGAHLGKGMGNRFLNDLSASDALIIVADASGKTDSTGLRTSGYDAAQDIAMVENELCEWLSSIIRRHMETLSRSADAAKALHEALAGLKVSEAQIGAAIAASGTSASKIKWNDGEIAAFARALLGLAKPYLVAANKMDSKEAGPIAARLEALYGKERVVRISAAIELALAKAESKGRIRWTSDNRFEIAGEKLSEEQAKALEYMRNFIGANGRAATKLINRTVFGLLDNIVVYPVEDENSYADSSGNVLPDAILLKRGSTARDLAMKIHTQIGEGMLYAIDARKKIRIAKEHKLGDGDIIRIVSSAKR